MSLGPRTCMIVGSFAFNKIDSQVQNERRTCCFKSHQFSVFLLRELRMFIEKCKTVAYFPSYTL